MPILGPVRFKKLSGFLVRFSEEDIVEIVKNVRRGAETEDEARNRVLKNISNILFDRNIPAIPSRGGVISLFGISPQDELSVKIGSFEKTIQSFEVRNVRLRDIEIQDFINELIKRGLSSKALLVDRDVYYFEHIKRIFPESERINVGVYKGFEIQYHLRNGDWYIVLIDRYKFYITPTVDYFIRKYGPEAFTELFKNWEVNTEHEYHSKHYGPAYAGKIEGIHPPDLMGYRGILEDIINYYRDKKPHVWEGYISKKLEKDPNPPIVFVNKAGNKLTYLSSILVFTPSVRQLASLIGEIWGERFVDYIHQIMNPTASKYHELMEKFKGIMEEVLAGVPFIESKTRWLELEVVQ